MGGIVCLTPFTLYLFGLNYLNRRDQPTVASARWDFTALLFGLSGTLAMLSLLILANLLSYLRGFPLVARELRRAWGEEQQLWLACTAIYLLIMAGLILWGYRTRRHCLVVYNAHPAAVDDALRVIFLEMKLNATRTGAVWTDGRGLVQVQSFDLFSNVQLRLLPSDPRQREELERRIRVGMATAGNDDNPMAPWISSAAISALLCDLCCVILILAATVWVK
jgi:hypothetical protein